MDPLDIVAVSQPIAEEIAHRVEKALGESFTAPDVLDVLRESFSVLADNHSSPNNEDPFWTAVVAQRTSRQLASDGYLRSQFTSALIGKFIRGVTFEPDEDAPALSKVSLSREIRAEVEVLKNLSFVQLILRPRLKVAERRGKEIVREMFEALEDSNGELLPSDFKAVFDRISPSAPRKRVLCDFIAGMTDRYAIEYFGRLRSENPQTIFKPF